MGLKEGTLESLIRSGCDPVSIVRDVFRQMLQPLDCLAWKGIIHRDVKPENILYLSQESGQYQFQLGDFGLCNRAISAVTSVGTPIYMAPEMGRKGGQTHKADVWSLFVTLLWTLDEEDFRQRSTQFKCYEDILEAILSTASRGERISAIREMAIVNVEERASAAQMLVKWCNGKGLSTPLNQIPSLDNRPSFSLTAIRPTALPSAPTPRTRTVQTRQRALRGNVPVPVATRYRINKAHDSLHPTPSRQS
jgi:serine/threonine protein kinase